MKKGRVRGRRARVELSGVRESGAVLAAQAAGIAADHAGTIADGGKRIPSPKVIFAKLKRVLAGPISGETVDEKGERTGKSTRIATAYSSAAQFARTNRAVLLRVALPVIYCLIFGSAGYNAGVYPFAISAVCAAAAGLPAVMTAAAAAVSSLLVRGGFYIALTSAAVASTLAVIKKFRGERSESAYLRVGVALAAGAVQTLLMSAADGISFYELCGVMMMAAVCPVICAALRGLFTAPTGMTAGAEAGIWALVYTAAYFVRDISPAGISIGVALSMAGTLYATYAFGIMRGIITGVAFGLAAPSKYSLVYAAAAAGSGILMGISPAAAVGAGTVIALALGVYSGSASAFSDLFPEFLFCAAIAGPLFHYRIVPAAGSPAASALTGERAILSEARLGRTKRKLTALSSSFGAISAVMEKLTKVFERPSLFDLRQMCDEAFDESCHNCSHCDRCWGDEYRATAGAITEMATALRDGKIVGKGLLTAGVRDRCPHTDAILSRINIAGAAQMRKGGDGGYSAVYADDFSAMSKVLSDMSSADDTDGEYDSASSLSLASRLREMGVNVDEVSVFGKSRRQVFVSGLESGCTAGGEELRAAAQSVLRGSLSMPEYRLEGRRVLMSMHSSPAYTARSGRCSLAKSGERCGDSVTVFTGEGGYFYALVSDGMGSGGDAAFTSNLCAVFLERLLGAGCSLVPAMDMMNGFLRRRGMECFTTVDLMEADLVTGDLKFVKSGAAPSLILRGGKLFKLESSTVPMGIISSIDAEQISFTAREGDFVIMLSDGALGGGDESPWLYDILCGEKPLLVSGCDLGAAAKTLAESAAKATGLSDDISVCVVEIRGV